jgi:phosphoglycolate phosphatase
MKSAIIFDMDGTLFQTNLILEPALEVTFDYLRAEGQWHGETPIEQYREIMGVPLSVVWETLCPMHSNKQRNESNKVFQQSLIKLIEQGKGALYRGVKETLAQLSEKFPLYIASNGPTAYLQAIVTYFELHQWIQAVYSIDRIASGNKSELVGLVKLENQISHGFVIGDRSSDIKAAADNSFTSIGVRFDFAQEEELAKADYIIEDFREIQSTVKKRTAIVE